MQWSFLNVSLGVYAFFDKKKLNAVALRERDLGNENLNKAILKI